MISKDRPLPRRDFLRGALVTAVMVPMAGSLASCASTGGGSTGGATGPVSADNPFGIAANSTVDNVTFNGGWGYKYSQFAAKQLEDQQDGVTVTVTPQTNIAQTLQPRFVAGSPPDVFDNDGAGAIAISTIRDQLEDLSDVINSNNYEGTKIADTLFDGVLRTGTLDGKLVIINYVMLVYAVYYSASLFESKGWTLPKTWDEMLDLGAKAKADGKYLMGWGKETGTYYQQLCISSAVKEGGDEVRLALENLEPDCWSMPAMQEVFKGLKAIIDAGYMQPGGAGTQFTAAQAQWSNDQSFVLYPAGGWIENEMAEQTKSGFEMTGGPEPTVTSKSAFPLESVHAGAGGAWVVPSQGKNVAGGKEFMRAMLSREAAANFASTTLSSTIVKDTVPEDGFGSTALLSQVKMLGDAGPNIFDWNFSNLYGMNTDQLVVWNTFLQGDSDVAALTKGLQEITDKVANDPSIEKVTVR